MLGLRSVVALSMNSRLHGSLLCSTALGILRPRLPMLRQLDPSLLLGNKAGSRYTTILFIAARSDHDRLRERMIVGAGAVMLMLRLPVLELKLKASHVMPFRRTQSCFAEAVCFKSTYTKTASNNSIYQVCAKATRQSLSASRDFQRFGYGCSNFNCICSSGRLGLPVRVRSTGYCSFIRLMLLRRCGSSTPLFMDDWLWQNELNPVTLARMSSSRELKMRIPCVKRHSLQAQRCPADLQSTTAGSGEHINKASTGVVSALS